LSLHSRRDGRGYEDPRAVSEGLTLDGADTAVVKRDFHCELLLDWALPPHVRKPAIMAVEEVLES